MSSQRISYEVNTDIYFTRTDLTKIGLNEFAATVERMKDIRKTNKKNRCFAGIYLMSFSMICVFDMWCISNGNPTKLHEKKTATHTKTRNPWGKNDISCFKFFGIKGAKSDVVKLST